VNLIKVASIGLFLVICNIVYSISILYIFHDINKKHKINATLLKRITCKVYIIYRNSFTFFTVTSARRGRNNEKFNFRVN